MMKSFFKKLASVLALAMVVSLAAPAAQTAAAAEAKEFTYKYQTGIGAAVKTVNLAKTGDTVDLKFIGIPDYANYELNWLSAGNGFTVDQKTGVITATADSGEGIVWLQVGDGQTYVSDPVTVTVGELTNVTIGSQDKSNKDLGSIALKVDEKMDLAFYGITDWNLGKYGYTWYVKDPSILDVDQKTGEITALKTGETTVTFFAPNKFNATNIVSTNALKVTVVANEVVADINKTQNTIELTFGKAVELKPEDVTMFRIYTAADDEEGLGNTIVDDERKGYEDFYVKTVWNNDDSKTVWTVQTFEDFTDAVWYEVHVAGYEKEEFQASVGPVASVKVNATKASLASDEGDVDLVPSKLTVSLYDAKGVDVTTRKVDGISNDDPSNITFWIQNENYEKYNLLDYNYIEFYAMATAEAMATYEANGVEKTSAEPTLVTPEIRNAYGVARVVDWTIVEANKDPDWSATVKEVPAGATDYILVALLQDTRGDYYCTYYKGAESGDKYDGKQVLWTEDEAQTFWLNGLYVEFKAMHMDTMLVETDGEIASYEEGRARFALYLYNQNKYSTNEFERELLSQYVKVCHPLQLNTFDVDTTTLNIMKNTEEEYQHQYDDSAKETIPDAYYSEFSVKSLKLTLKDIHGGKATLEDAATADFSLTLTSETNSNAALKTLVEETLEERLKDAYNAALADGKVEFKLTVNAKDFYDDVENKYITTKSQVKFRITDATTKTTKNITVNLVDLVEDKVTTDEDNDSDGKKDILYSDVDLIKEFVDEMKSNMYFEKFVVNTNKVSVEQKIADAYNDDSYKNNGYSILLKQQDVKGHDIGYESDIWVANAAIVNNQIALENIIATNGTNDASGTVSRGDRVLVITDKYGKVYPVLGNKEYTNPAYSAKEVGFEAPTDTLALGVYVDKAWDVTSASGTALSFDKYQFVFRTADETTKELIYAKEGTYTATIRTIESINTEKNIVTFTKATGLTDKVTFSVVNNNAQVAYANRDAVYYEDRSIYEYAEDRIITREIDDEDAVKALILETFNFTLGGSAWNELQTWEDEYYNKQKLTVDDILYYTYTVTPSNNQLVINSVTFKVPVLGYVDGRAERTGEWYRSTCTVNKSITFGE